MANPELAAAALRDLHCCNFAGRYITVTEARPPRGPKGMMSEGFATGTSTNLSPDSRRDKTRQRSPRSSPPRGRCR